METLKICILSRNYGSVIHGPSTYGNILMDALIKDGHEVHIITPDNTATSDKAKIIYVKKPMDLKHATWIQLSRIFSKKLKEITKKEKFDVIHFLNSLEVMRYNCKLDNVVTTIQAYHFVESTLNLFHYTHRYPVDWYIRYPYYNIGRMFEIRGLNKMKHIIPLSEYMKKDLIKFYGIPENKMTRVYHSINANKEKTKRDKFNYNILLVGNNYQTKGISTLIRAAKILKNDFPQATYKIVGNDKKVLPYMKKLAEKEGVNEKFTFLGQISNTELQQKYKESDLFVLPSTIESFGMVFLEAMNYGLPVIGSNVGGIPEIINDGKNGFLVDPENPKEIAEKIRIIFEDETLRKKISENAYKRVGDFPISKMVDETIKVYKNLT